MDYLIYKISAPVSILIIILSIIFTLRFVKERNGNFLLRFQLSVLGFISFNYFEFLSTNFDKMVFYASIQHIFLLLISITWIKFALSYTGYYSFIGKGLKAFVYIYAIFHVCIGLSNSSHKLFYKSISIVGKNGFSEINATYGIFFWSETLFIYVLLTLGVSLIVISYIRGESFYRKQAIWVVLGFLIPFFTNFIYIFRIIPGFDKDFSSVSFSISGLFLFVGMFFYRFLQITPIGRGALFNEIKDVVIILDPNLKIIDYNFAAINVFSLSKDSLGMDVEDSALWEFTHDIRSVNNMSRELVTTKKYEDSIYEISIKNIYSKDCELQTVLFSMVDITQKMALIFELEETNNRLEQMQVQLIQNEKMATLGLLSAGVAHEINNPLSYIKSNYNVVKRYLDNIEQICDGTDSAKASALHKNIEEIKDVLIDTGDGIQRINSVIKYLLGFSRTNSEYRANLYDLNKGIKDTLAIAENYIRDRADIDIQLGDIPQFLTNGDEINQVLLNLLTNAAQSIPDNMIPGKISVKTFIEGDKIICEVMDSGVPIKPEDRDKIFLPFFTSKTESVGTGLGLSISKNIIEKEFLGRLYIMDSEDKIFRIELPLKYNY